MNHRLATIVASLLLVPCLDACPVAAESDDKGAARPPRDPVAEFRAANNVGEQLRLLPEIDRAYAGKELPDETRYLMALHLLRPHLSWHAVYAPRPRDEARKYASFGAWKRQFAPDD